ncbi:MAG TPA: HRDC domain-containing protein, partial [Anaerolineaceae bacterium]|nr:HRDC domain-containing protein [Anaerolineaceae bacterium]
TNNALYALLRQKRKELADAAGVPPYVIFPDTTLIEMAAYYPQSMERLMDITGVGKVKAERYGEIFLGLIQTFCKNKNLPEKQKVTRRSKSDTGRRYVFVGEAYNAGESVTALMKRYNVTAGTILDHLARFIAAGNRLRKSSDLRQFIKVSPELQQAALAAFRSNGAAYLRPVYDQLRGQVDFEQLKILRLVYLIEAQST